MNWIARVSLISMHWSDWDKRLSLNIRYERSSINVHSSKVSIVVATPLSSRGNVVIGRG